MSLKSLSREERTIAVLVRNNWQVEKIVESSKNEENLNIEIKTGGDLFQLPSTVDLYKLILALNNS
jgi:superfamily I DNA/RNA helicase